MIVIKRSMNPGFAGIENELYYEPEDGDAVRRRQGGRRRDRRGAEGAVARRRELHDSRADLVTAWVGLARCRVFGPTSHGLRERRRRHPHAAHGQGLRPGARRARTLRSSSSSRAGPRNHNMTEPWRFRVLGPEALAALKAGRRARGRGQARPRAHALVASVVMAGEDPVADEEDLIAASLATYIVLLGAHAADSRATGARPRCCAPRGPRRGRRSGGRARARAHHLGRGTAGEGPAAAAGTASFVS